MDKHLGKKYQKIDYVSLSQLPELSDEELWNDQWNKTKQLADSLWTEAEQLIEKKRITYLDTEEPDFLDWSFQILPEIFEKRIGKDREVLRKFGAFHPFIGSTACYSDKLSFDLNPPHNIQSCARILLLELREANKEESNAPIIF